MRRFSSAKSIGLTPLVASGMSFSRDMLLTPPLIISLDNALNSLTASSETYILSSHNSQRICKPQSKLSFCKWRIIALVDRLLLILIYHTLLLELKCNNFLLHK